ncbi:MAG: adenosylcobinamide-GDP ribazoletransferase [Primorskyibacter sp.]
MTAMRQRVAQAQVAVMMMTRLPAGRLPARVPTLAEAAWAYPLLGLVTGGALWGSMTAGLALGLAPLTAAMVALVVLALLTGGLHHDGLADFADGMGGGHDRARVLDIMRDSRIGSYGVIALILVLGAQATALSETPLSLLLVLGVAVGSRVAMMAVLSMLPPARCDGLGQAAVARWPALLPGGCVLAVLALWSGGALWPALLGMAAVTLWVARLAHRRIGGQTGDVLGATQMVSETAGFLVLAAML